MVDRSQDGFPEGHNVDGGEDLRQALMRLTSPQVEDTSARVGSVEGTNRYRGQA